MTESAASVEHVTCLGCGCACDDITVTVRSGRIASAEHACALGVRWFGDGAVPGRVLVRGADVSLERALDEAATLLSSARSPLVYLAADVTCEAQRAAVSAADVLGGALDSVTSSTARAGILAAQRRGRAGATLGEIRNRADLILFWAMDPSARYPRYTARYAPDPEGVHVPAGRAGRTVVGVDVGERQAPADHDAHFSFTAAEECDALALTRAAVLGRAAANAAPDSLAARAAALAARLLAARYVVIVHDAEPLPNADARPPAVADGILALSEALNASTRSAVSTLRAGGNCSGADSVVTWQTGFPMTVDFYRGWPRYRPDDGAAALLGRREIDAVLLVGAHGSLPPDVRSGLAGLDCVVIGPRASEANFAPRIAIDGGVAGIHEGGIAVRLDDVPLPLRPVLPSPSDTAAVLGGLAARLQRLRSVAAS